ncbi:MAG: hypothetical protein U1E04_00605 [Hylemonella sp.]|nr:hypothetical protein [Hylemonella sp.]
MLASKAGRGLLLVLACGLAHAAEKEDALYASYACQQYALAALKTLGKPRMDATRPATPAKDKRWAGMADVWLASGALHAQARFGAPMVRSEYQCAVQKTPGAGWKLLELQWPQGRP